MSVGQELGSVGYDKCERETDISLFIYNQFTHTRQFAVFCVIDVSALNSAGSMLIIMKNVLSNYVQLIFTLTVIDQLSHLKFRTFA
jgi:hypothetical protein